MPISALNGFNINEVIELILEVLPESPAYYSKDDVTDKSERFFIEEIIREKILKHYKKENLILLKYQLRNFLKKKKLLKFELLYMF